MLQRPVSVPVIETLREEKTKKLFQDLEASGLVLQDPRNEGYA